MVAQPVRDAAVGLGYALLEAIRRIGLTGAELARADVDTSRLLPTRLYRSSSAPVWVRQWKYSRPGAANCCMTNSSIRPSQALPLAGCL